MKKIISILGMFLLINSLFANELALVNLSKDKTDGIYDRGPTLANHSKVDGVTLQLKSTEQNQGPTYSNIAKKGDILRGSNVNNIFWAGVEKLNTGAREVFKRTWGEGYKPGEIIIKNNKNIYKINFILERKEVEEGGINNYYSYKIKILNTDWVIENKATTPSYDGNEQLVLTKQDGSTRYIVTILQGPCWRHAFYNYHQNKDRTGVICLDVDELRRL